MRTTIDLPDELYRTLKVRAALDGTTLRELVRHLVEQGLHQAERSGPAPGTRWGPPPVVIEARGGVIRPLAAEELRRLEEEEDEARLSSDP